MIHSLLVYMTLMSMVWLTQGSIKHPRAEVRTPTDPHNLHEVKRAFHDFQEVYNITWKEPERTHRLKHFHASILRAHKRNRLRRRGDEASYGITRWSWMSEVEFRNEVLLQKPIATVIRKEHMLGALHEQHTVTRIADNPAKYDWRERGAVTAIKNQGKCGASWAFSAVSTLETFLIIDGQANSSSINLSPQQIMDCDHGPEDSCTAGSVEEAFDFIVANDGLQNIAQYPYNGKDGECVQERGHNVAKMKSWEYASKTHSEESLANRLVQHGAFSMCIDGTSLQDYKGGIITGPQCCTLCLINLCVQLVGYDTDGSTPFWTVRNSWGEDFGEGGFLRLEMWDNTCGLTSRTLYPILK